MSEKVEETTGGEKTKPLTMPTGNPLLELQKLNLEEMNRPVGASGSNETPPPPPDSSSIRESVKREDKTALREDGITGRRKHGNPAGSTGARQAARTEGRKAGKAAVQQEGREGGKQEGSDDYLVRVRTALEQRRIYTGGVKPTVDISEELSNRIRRYCADRRGVTLRAIFTELVEAFLDEEGY